MTASTTSRSYTLAVLLFAVVNTASSAEDWLLATTGVGGRCDALVLAGRQISQTCNLLTADSYLSGRASFSFASDDASIIAFAGDGAQKSEHDGTFVVPIDRVIVGSMDISAAGACRGTDPDRGVATLQCEARANDTIYKALFVTDGRKAGVIHY